MGKLLIIAAVTIAVAIAIAAVAIATFTPADNQFYATPSPYTSTTVTPTATPITAPTPTPSATPMPTPKTNESAIITFEAPIQIFEYTWQHQNEVSAGETTYAAIAYIAWNPTSYVRYYEVTAHYHGNTKPTQALFNGADFRLWGQGDNILHAIDWTENQTRLLALTDPHTGYVQSTYTASNTYWEKLPDGTPINGPKVWPDTQHGYQVIQVSTTYSVDESKDQNQIGATSEDLMRWLVDYTQGWTFTIRPIA
jgi:hypothetical protein